MKLNILNEDDPYSDLPDKKDFFDDDEIDDVDALELLKLAFKELKSILPPGSVGSMSAGRYGCFMVFNSVTLPVFPIIDGIEFKSFRSRGIIYACFRVEGSKGWWRFDTL